jgi:Family of unknown function (DUF6220)
MSEVSRSARRSRATPGRPLAIVAGITMFFIALQFVLAGYGIFERQYHKADDGWFEPHQAVGYLTILSIIAVLVVALLTRQARGIVVRAVVLLVLGLLQPLLARLGGDTSPWYGVLHAAFAVAIAAIDGTLIGEGTRASAQP